MKLVKYHLHELPRTLNLVKKVTPPWQTVSVCLLVLSCLISPVRAQDVQTKARIEFEAARIMIKDGKPKIALQRLEEVQKKLGDFPDLLAIMAQAEYDIATGSDRDNDVARMRDAKEHIDKALASNDATFKAGASYQTAIQLAAKIDLKWRAFECKMNCPNKAECKSAEEYSAKKEDFVHRCMMKDISLERCDEGAERVYGRMFDYYTDRCSECKNKCESRH